MRDRRFGWGRALAGLLLLAVWRGRAGWAQAPTIEQTGIISAGGTGPRPGALESLLGPFPGSSGVSVGAQPGRDDLLLGRVGTSAPRVPTAITMPGGVYQGPPARPGISAPQPLPVPRAPFYGTLALPKEEEEGPSGGLTLDQAIDILARQNLDLRAKWLEIPQARADILTAGLRANPILYADSQLVPYGSDSPRRPGGPTQYDVNISHPLDYSHKRRARMAYATRALQVMEAQYQNEVRLAIQNLYNAYVDVLAARETVRAAQTSVEGLDELLRINRELYRQKNASRPDVDQAYADRQIAAAGLLSAREELLQRKRTLAEILNLPPELAGKLELRGAIGDLAPPPPPEEQLIEIAMNSRPDLASYRLGIVAAQANLRLQLANRFADAYLLYQPYTFQNNAPLGLQSATSWALGITVPLPVYNRNQGNVERARINVYQSQVQLNMLERRIVTEVQQALAEYRLSAGIVRHIRLEIEPALKRARDDRFELFHEGEHTKFVFLDAQRKYNDTVKIYLDSIVRHRRSMLALDTVVGQRIVP
jgi:cobalt-zinc-cadmium efflux system outer membrane protein